MTGGFISTSLHHPDSFSSWAPEENIAGHPDDNTPATVPCHKEVFFL